MKGKRKIAFLSMSALLVVACVSWLVLARLHRAIALQPIDYVRGISTEIRIADSAPKAWRMVKAVSSMFWGSYEVRMVDGRAFSSLPFYCPAPPIADQPFVDDHDIDVMIIDMNEDTGEVQHIGAP
jgi:hypothetical protein